MLNLGHNGGKPNTVGGILRYWRRLKKMSQMELALQAEEQSFAVQSLRGIESLKVMDLD